MKVPTNTPRATAQLAALVAVMLPRPSEYMYGLELAKAAKLFTGTLYPMLARLERAGWLESCWEDVDPSVVGRPRRRLYRLTPTGRAVAPEAIEKRRVKLGIEPARNPVVGLT